MNQTRRLAAILAAEVVGYSRTRKAQSRRRTPASKELKGGFLTERPNSHQIGNGSSPPRLFSNSGPGVKLSVSILAGSRVLSAVGTCPPHDGVG
jgi:hypothetical protein